jgi:hypothetical protein
VVDPGGGTLDWYVASKAKSSWSRSGAYPKAMLHCAYAVLDQIDPELRDQFEIVMRVDNAIREGAPSFRLYGRDHALEPYRTVIDAVLAESMEKMMATVGTHADIDVVLPHSIGILEAGSTFLENGAAKFQACAAAFKACLETGYWPDLSCEATLEIAPWQQFSPRPEWRSGFEAVEGC